MSDKAGKFSSVHRVFRGGAWRWENDEFKDSNGSPVAQFRSDVMHYGKENLLIENSTTNMAIRLRATTSQGELFTLANQGFGVSKLGVNCSGRRYTATRVSPFRKERVIYSEDGIVARTKPRGEGLDVIDEPEYADVSTLDIVFVTWGCVLIDLPWRNTKV